MGDKKRVLVALSGGTDSAITAALLKSQGYEVIGYHLRLWNPKDGGENLTNGVFSRCCYFQDAETKARTFAEKLGIPFSSDPAHERFENDVVDPFIHSFVGSQSPSPCVKCNGRVKIPLLFEKADAVGCDYVATGHYAQVHLDYSSGKARLAKAVDAAWDQSYLLFEVTRAQIERLLLPLGGIPRSMVRRLAGEMGFPSVSDAADRAYGCLSSRPLVFKFFESRVAKALRMPGPTRTVEGYAMDQHKGLYHYHLGQTEDLPIYFDKKDDHVVVDFDSKRNALVLGTEADLSRRSLRVKNLRWHQMASGAEGFHQQNCRIHFSPQGGEMDCKVTLFENHMARVELEKPVAGIARGRPVVFYENNEILGGGYVDETFP